VDPRAGLDNVEKRKFLTPPGLNFDLSVVQPVASRYTEVVVVVVVAVVVIVVDR
jgi:hypothetical protein